MPVNTQLKRSFILWNALYLVITLGLGIWGAYDYWVTNYGENNIVDFNDVAPPGVVRTETGNFRIVLNDGRVADVHPWLWCDDGRKLYGVRYWID